MKSFSETDLESEILDAIKSLGFEKPTPIQAEAIPHLLSSDRDLIASAQTGTGKTAAFGLPSIQLTNIENKTTQTLVLCPTRELCLQITKDITNYSKNCKGLSTVAVYGGASIDPQTKALKRGAHIVVATPGRAKDLIRRKKLLLGNVARVVLDEADEMLSMGFKEDLDAILSETPKKKQILLFSATMSKEIVAITKKFMQDPLEISAARVNQGADNVKHFYYMVQVKDRYELLKRIADINPNIYGIVFCRTRRETKEISNKLMQDSYNADALHGDLSQAQRDEVMGRFRKRQLQILVATDVAARGLDVNDLTHIINFNLPDDSEIYIHRSGRTGRAGKSGTSIAIINTREARKIKEIQKKSGIVFSKASVPSGKDICTKQLYALIDKIEKVKVDETQIEPFLPTIYEKLDWLSREELIKHFVSAEFNRFLSYYKYSKDINVSENQKEESGKRGEKRRREDKRKESHSRLFINVGSKNNLNPARLIGLINEGLDSGDADIGKIDIMKTFSFFEIEDASEAKLIKALEGQTFEGVSLVIEPSKEKSASGSFSKEKSSRRRDHGKKKEGRWGDKNKRHENRGRRNRNR